MKNSSAATQAGILCSHFQEEPAKNQLLFLGMLSKLFHLFFVIPRGNIEGCGPKLVVLASNSTLSVVKGSGSHPAVSNPPKFLEFPIFPNSRSLQSSQTPGASNPPKFLEPPNLSNSWTLQSPQISGASNPPKSLDPPILPKSQVRQKDELEKGVTRKKKKAQQREFECKRTLMAGKGSGQGHTRGAPRTIPRESLGSDADPPWLEKASPWMSLARSFPRS